MARASHPFPTELSRCPLISGPGQLVFFFQRDDMKRGERITSRYGCDQTGKVAAYLLVRRLQREVGELLAAIPDLVAFWAQSTFKALRVDRSSERDRLTVENVIGRLCHCPNPKNGLYQVSQVRAGKRELVDFIKEIIDTRKGNRI